jgi:hypothetical protein
MYTDFTCGEYLQLSQRLYGRGNLNHLIDVFALGEHLGTTGGTLRRVSASRRARRGVAQRTGTAIAG